MDCFNFTTAFNGFTKWSLCQILWEPVLNCSGYCVNRHITMHWNKRYFWVLRTSKWIYSRLTINWERLNRRKIGNKICVVTQQIHHLPNLKHKRTIHSSIHKFGSLSSSSTLYANYCCNLCAKSDSHFCPLLPPPPTQPPGCVIYFRLSQQVFVFVTEENWLAKILLCAVHLSALLSLMIYCCFIINWKLKEMYWT